MDILTSVHLGKRLHSQTCMLHFSAKHHAGGVTELVFGVLLEELLGVSLDVLLGVLPGCFLKSYWGVTRGVTGVLPIRYWGCYRGVIRGVFRGATRGVTGVLPSCYWGCYSLSPPLSTLCGDRPCHWEAQIAAHE